MMPPMAALHLPRIGLSALAGPAVDFLAFNTALLSGMPPVTAHLVSFAAALAAGWLLQLRPAWPARNGQMTDSPLAWLHATALAAVLLRGGVFGLFAAMGWTAPAAILPAILVSSLVMAAGKDLLLCTVPVSRLELLRRLAVAVVSYSFVLRLSYAPQVELLPEEAYYWNYAQHPALGYLDHPPMVAWLIRLGTALLGNTELGIRAGPLLTQALAAFFVYRMTRELHGTASALIALLLMQVLPFYFIAGMMTTPDAPLTAAWAGCLYFLQRALLAGQPRAWWGAGLCLGLGLLSKYSIGLVVPAALLFALLDRQARRWLSRWQAYAACLLAVVLFSPVLVWNAQHEWASFAFQTSRRLADPARFSLHQLLLSILVLITPIGLVSLPVILRGGSGAAPEDDVGAMQGRRRLLFIRVFVLVPLSVFTLFSLRHEVKLDWTGETWLALVPALAAWLAAAAARTDGRRSSLQAAWAPTGAITLLLLAGLLYHLALGLPGLGYSAHMQLLPAGWRQLGTQVDKLAAQMAQETGQRPLVVGMERYMLASEIAFYAPDPAISVANTTSVYLFDGLGIMYERWFPPQDQQGRTLLLVGWTPQELSAARLAGRVTSLEPIHCLDLVRNGRPIRRVYYRVTHGYQPAGGSSQPAAE